MERSVEPFEELKIASPLKTNSVHSPRDVLKHSNDSKAKGSNTKSSPSTPVRSNSPTLPEKKHKKTPSENVRASWKTPENMKFKSWSKPSPWSASKAERFKEENMLTPPPTKYNMNLSSLDSKEFASIFKSQSPRFKEPKIETPPPTKYNVVDPNLKHGDLVSASFKTTTKREFEMDKKPTSPSCTQYSPVTSSIDLKNGIISSFRSSVDRFKLPTPSTPPPTKYNVNSSTFQVKKDNKAFGSLSPRFVEPKSYTPPSTMYDTNKYSDFCKQVTKNTSSPFSSTSPRFFDLTMKEATKTPPAGAYTVPNNWEEIIYKGPTKK
ncbi:hypothetical protein C9374_009955 [Naegleria lovaniensis]|uniref:Uncharacterized protein n=1 Tax=Naegleria lovaniensis TaxID=51637 RepID=A0AA88GD38_NAELO|nr:uncharacterized protein C9374_009955 [Naegleria lovaniensis]KAG2375332.1 hypothetical protein C9374_009955 [Naegleria lovaniensis]